MRRACVNGRNSWTGRLMHAPAGSGWSPSAYGNEYSVAPAAGAPAGPLLLASLSSGRVAGAGGVEAQAIQRAGGGDEQVVTFGAAEGEVGDDLRKVQLAEQGAVGVEAVDAIVGGGPDPAGVVEPDAVEGTRVAGGEHLPAGQGTVVAHVEQPDVLPAGIDDVELAFVGGECEPVGAQESVGGDADFS